MKHFTDPFTKLQTVKSEVLMTSYCLSHSKKNECCLIFKSVDVLNKMENLEMKKNRNITV